MKTITLRDIPEAIASRIEDRAIRTGASLNRTVLQMLAETMEDSALTVYHDLDHLAGTWTAEEADAFDACLMEQRQIDPADWQ